MATEQGKKEILELVAAGKISAAEAIELLASQAAPAPEEEKESVIAVVEESPAAAEKKPGKEPGKKPNWLRVRVTDSKSGRRKVSVNLPIRLLRAGLHLGANFIPDIDGLDWDALQALIEDTDGGMLVEVEDDEGGEHVQIFVD